MLAPDVIEQIAQQLEKSEESKEQLPQISLQYPNMTVNDSYAIQKAWIELKLKKGHQLRGHKVGLTSRAMQMASNITEPDFGVLMDYMFYADGARLPIEKFIVPRVEVELAFILGKDLTGPDVTLLDVYKATEYVMPALEIIDARFQQIDPTTKATRKVFDTIADNAANAAVVMGGRPIKVDEFDLRWVGSILSLNGQIEETGVAAGVLNHPGNGVVWLANKLGKLGVSLKAGQVILSGSFTRPVAAQDGDVFSADYGPLGMIQCQFI